MSGLGELVGFRKETFHLSGYSIFEINIGVAHRFVEHKIKTINNILIEHIEVDTQVHISLVTGLVDKNVEVKEVKEDLEEVEETKFKNECMTIKIKS